MIIVMTM